MIKPFCLSNTHWTHTKKIEASNNISIKWVPFSLHVPLSSLYYISRKNAWCLKLKARDYTYINHFKIHTNTEEDQNAIAITANFNTRICASTYLADNTKEELIMSYSSSKVPKYCVLNKILLIRTKTIYYNNSSRLYYKSFIITYTQVMNDQFNINVGSIYH